MAVADCSGGTAMGLATRAINVISAAIGCGDVKDLFSGTAPCIERLRTDAAARIRDGGLVPKGMSDRLTPAVECGGPDDEEAAEIDGSTGVDFATLRAGDRVKGAMRSGCPPPNQI